MRSKRSHSIISKHGLRETARVLINHSLLFIGIIRCRSPPLHYVCNDADLLFKDNIYLSCQERPVSGKVYIGKVNTRHWQMKCKPNAVFMFHVEFVIPFPQFEREEKQHYAIWWRWGGRRECYVLFLYGLWASLCYWKCFISHRVGQISTEQLRKLLLPFLIRETQELYYSCQSPAEACRKWVLRRVVSME